MSRYIGQQFGNYRLVSLLGKGGFAEVYLGEHIHLRSQTAIKVLLTQLTNEDRENFLHEALTLVNLNHINIVRLLDFGMNSDDMPFLVMDFAPNGSLRQRHPKGTQVPLQQTLGYVKQIASALQYAHNEGVVHRDVKPENILIGKRQEILLTDFGIAAPSGNSMSQSVKEVAGTLAYMAPEQFLGKSRPASDQYALAVMAYEWLVGERPFLANASFVDLASQQLLASPPSIQGRTPEITSAIEQVIMIALAKDYKSRFPSVGAFAQALEQAYYTEGPMLQRDFTPHPASSVHYTPSSVNFPSNVDVPTRLDHAHQHQTPRLTPIPGDPALIYASAATETNYVTPHSANMADSMPETVPVFPIQPARTTRRRSVLIGLGAALLVAGGGTGVVINRILAQAQPHSSGNSTTPARAQPGSTVTSKAMFGLDSQHTHFNSQEQILTTGNVSQLQLKWKMQTGGALSLSSPAVSQGVVYIGSHDGNLYAFKITDGTMLWKKALGDVGFSSPAVTDSTVYIGSGDANVYAIDLATQQINWKVTTGGPVLSSPNIVNGMLYIGSEDKKVYAIDAQSGKVFWTYLTGDKIHGSPAINQDTLYVGSFDGKCYAIDIHSGAKRWVAQVGAEINTSPAVSGNNVLFGAWDQKLHNLDGEHGREAWFYGTNGFINSSPAVANDMVYFGSKDNTLYALKVSTYELKWKQRTQGEIASSPTIANGVVYVGSWDHSLYAFDAQRGDLLWRYQTTDGIESSPAVVDGVVYVGSRDHALYAFHLPGS